jgi:hypothetical protein
LLWMATPLPRPLSHASGCLTFQKLLLRVAPGGHWQANRSSNENAVPTKTIRYWARVNAAPFAALGLLVTSDAFRNRSSPQLASAVTAEITQNINSPGTRLPGSLLNGL